MPRTPKLTGPADRPPPADAGKTRAELLLEVARLRRRVAELEELAEQEEISAPGLTDLRGEARRSRAQWEALVNSVDGIVWEGDARTFEFTFVSKRAEEILGYPVKRWLEEPGFWQEHVHPEDREWALSFCYTATHELRDHEFEYRMIAADGRTVWLRDIVSVVSVDKQPVTIRGLMVDITEIKRAEERKRIAEERARRHATALVSLATSDPLTLGDLERFGRLATETAARVLGVERIGIWFFNEDRSVLRLWDLYELSRNAHGGGTEIEAASYPRYFAALEKGRVVASDDARNDPATSEFAKGYLEPLGITSMLDAPIRRGGGVRGVVCHEHVGLLREWTPDEREFAAAVADLISLALETAERRRAEIAAAGAQAELLRRREEEKKHVEDELAKARDELVRRTRLSVIGQVAASIAHELRNPLGAIRNAVFYLRRRVRGEQSEVREYLGIIDQEVHTADRIIRNLLEMSRAKQPIKRDFDLDRTVREVLARVEGTADLRLEVDLDPRPFVLHADPDQLEQVLGNLITNAVQVDPAPRSLSVSARREPDAIRIRVADDGAGVPAEARARIFEPLFTTKAKGTGLGLTICRQIVEQHGGTIELTDASPGGAVFEVRLPLR